MRKIRKLSLFGILGVVIAVLFLISISFTQAQVKIQGKPEKPPGQDKPKPGKPGEGATWAVRIPTQSPGLMFYGMDAIDGNPYYLHNGDNIEVSVERNKFTGFYGQYHEFVYALKFFLTNKDTDTPPEYDVGFNNVDLYDVDYPDGDKPCCQFPDVTSGPPDCMAAFLNNTHPYYNEEDSVKNYEFFWIRVNIFDFEIEEMSEGKTYKFLLRNTEGDPPLDDSFDMKTQYRKGCQREPKFHNVSIYNHGETDYNIWITRLPNKYYTDISCEGIWRIEVIGPLHVREMYCSKEKGRQTFYYPMKAKGNFHFYVDWIKNPNTQ